MCVFLNLLNLDDFAAEQQLGLAQLNDGNGLVVMVDHDQRFVGAAHATKSLRITKERHILFIYIF